MTDLKWTFKTPLLEREKETKFSYKTSQQKSDALTFYFLFFALENHINEVIQIALRL